MAMKCMAVGFPPVVFCVQQKAANFVRVHFSEFSWLSFLCAADIMSGRDQSAQQAWKAYVCV
jgi:hypothetical protein